MDGWAKLGAALGGAGGGQDAFMRGEAAAYDIDRKRMEARKARDEAMARSQYAEALAGMGMDPTQASSLATLMRGGANPSQTMQAMQTQQGMGMQSELWNRISGGQAPAEWGGLNQALAVLDGKPVQVTGQGGGVLYNRLADPSAGSMVTTAPGQASIAQRMAAAEASKAQALERGAQARLATVKADAGGFAPRGAGGGGFGKPSIQLLDRMLGTVNEDGESVPDVEQQREFMRWQADMALRDPRYRDPQFALSQFLRETDTASGRMFDGTEDVPQRVSLAPQAAAPAAPIRARNPNTGEVIELRNGQWVPVQ